MRLADCWMAALARAQTGFVSKVETLASLEQDLVRLLDAAQAQARDHGFIEAEIREALFAVVAWIDEQAMTREWAGASAWRLAPLQRHYFSTTRAGVEFFTRLDGLPDTAAGAREVFGLMLLAGFQGRYAGMPAGELTNYRIWVLERLMRDSEMAPLDVNHPLFPSTMQLGVHSSVRPAWRPSLVLILLVVVPLLFMIILYGSFDYALGSTVSSLLKG